MHHFFIPSDWISNVQVTLSGSVARRVCDVLHLGPGDHILVLDNSSWAWEVTLQEVGPEQVVGDVVRRTLAQGESRTKITLYQGMLEDRRFESVLRTGTELGIVEFVPLISARAIVADLQEVNGRRSRWQHIIHEAAEQARRGRLPNLEPAMLFPQACERAQQQGGLALIPWEGTRSLSLRSVLTGQEKRPFIISLFIGPEEGFTPEEVKLARRYGIQPITLGPRILRAETGGLVAAAAIMYELGDLE